MDLLISEGQRISTIYFMMEEENVKLQLKQPWVMVGTDAGGLDPRGRLRWGHIIPPRLWFLYAHFG